MKFKKALAIALVGVMALTMGACGSSSQTSTSGTDTSGSTGEKKSIVVWTLAKDLETFATKYMTDNPNIEVKTVVIEPANYPTKVQTALNGGESEPDVIVGEPQMLQDFYDAGYFEDLNQDPYDAQQYADKIVDYVWKVGQSSDGVQRAISYQITPAGIYYRRDIAKKVFGTDDPDEVGKLFASYSTILDTAQKLKDAGYRIFASDAEMSYFAGDSAWVVDNKLNVDQARLDYMDLSVNLYKNDLIAFASQWSTPWYQAMSGPIPILTAAIAQGTDSTVNVWDSSNFSQETANLDKTEVFAYGLPAWGVLTMKDNCGATSGNWGVCSGPSSGFGGGTYIGISSASKKKDLAWDFIKYCTLNEDTANWWITESQGDTVSLKSALEQHKDDENATYGNEKLYAFWQKEAEKIDYSKVTRYDKTIGDAWTTAISNIEKGTSTKEAAISDFYDSIQSTYPDIQIDR